MHAGESATTGRSATTRRSSRPTSAPTRMRPPRAHGGALHGGGVARAPGGDPAPEAPHGGDAARSRARRGPQEPGADRRLGVAARLTLDEAGQVVFRFGGEDGSAAGALSPRVGRATGARRPRKSASVGFPAHTAGSPAHGAEVPHEAEGSPSAPHLRPGDDHQGEPRLGPLPLARGLRLRGVVRSGGEGTAGRRRGPALQGGETRLMDGVPGRTAPPRVLASCWTSACRGTCACSRLLDAS